MTGHLPFPGRVAGQLTQERARLERGVMGDGLVHVERHPLGAPRGVVGRLLGRPNHREVEVYSVEGVEFKLVRIPGERFVIGQTQVTQALYQAVMSQNPSHFKEGEIWPVERVSWEDGTVFCNALSERSGLTPAYRGTDNSCELIEGANGFRLPFEVEWELAARGGQSFEYAGSDVIDEVAWYHDNSGRETHPVGQKKANGYGLYDMSGNVWEWCADDRDNPGQHRLGASWRARCGGSWRYDAFNCRVSRRGSSLPVYRSHDLGLRLSRSLR